MASKQINADLDVAGDISATSFIMDGKTSADVLLGDGTTTPLSGLGTGIDGSGAASYIPKFSDSDTLTSSMIYQDGTAGIAIGKLSATEKLDVAGSIIADTIKINGGSASDVLLGDGNIGSYITDHTSLTSIGTNTHAQIDTHIGDSTIHFTQASISITESQISDLGPYTNNNGTVTTVSVGTGLDVSNASTTPSITLDLSELTDMTATVVGTTDEIILLDNGAERRKRFSEIGLSVFSNDENFIALTDVDKTHIDSLNVDADTLDGNHGSEFLRSNVADTKTSGDLLFNNNIKLKFGTDSDMRIYNDGSGTSVISLFNDDLEIWDGTTSRFTFGRTTGDFTSTGEVISVGVTSSEPIKSDFSNTTVYDATGSHSYLEANYDQMKVVNSDNTQGESFSSLYFKHQGDGGIASGRMVLTNGNAGDSEFRWLLRDSAHTSYTEEKMLLSGEGDLSITGTFSGDGSLLTDVDADTLDGIDSLSFVRSDALDTITGIHYYEATQVIKDANRIDFGTGNDMRIYHSSNQNYIDVHNGDIKVRDGGAGATKFTFDISEGDFISTGAIELSGYLGLAGGTFTDADDVFTDLGMTGNGDITIGNNTTGSTNFPTEFGQSLLVHGASNARDFGIYKATLGDFAFHLGQKDSSSNWEWSEIIHADNRNNRDWETTGGDTSSSNGSDTWARVADFNIDTNFGGGSIDFEVNTNSSSYVSDANLTIFIRRNGGSGLVNVYARLNALNSNNANMMLDYDSFKIIANSATDIQLWINKKQNYGRIHGRVTGKALINTTETYYTDAAWQAAEPTGSVDNDTTSAITTGNNSKIFHQGLSTFDYDGDFTSNKFIMDGKTSDDILLGDGTTTSLSGLSGGGGNFLASDGNDTFDGSSGTGITFEDNTFIKFGTDGDLEMKMNTTSGYFELNFLNNQNFSITEGTTTRLETDWGRDEIDIYDTQLILSGTGGYVEAEEGFKKTGKDNTQYLMADGGTRYSQDGVSFFMVKANTVGQTTTTSNTTLAGMWDSPNISDSVFTFTASTGELEIDEFGMLEVTATLTGYQSGGDRHQLSAYIYVNGSRYAGTTNYASRNNTQRSGGVTISALVSTAPSDIITIRVKHLGQASIIGRSLLPDETFITAKFWSGNQTPP